MYLRLVDYRQQIQSDNLNQIISTTDSIRVSAELAAQAELKSYLVQKYNTDAEFTSTRVWSPTTIYKAANRVYLDAGAWNITALYTLYDLVLYQGSVYMALGSSNGVDPVTGIGSGDWELIGSQYDMFYGAYPKPLYDFYTEYAIGDEIFYKDKTYTCVRANTGILPDNTSIGSTYWGTGVAYSIVAETSLSNTTYWTAGDSRNQQMVLYYIDIALYIMHSRISPRNIPELRMDRYDSAIKWLRACAKGDVTADLIRIEPFQGSRLRFGSAAKNNNTY